MKTITIDKPLKINFLNEHDTTTVQILNPHPSFKIPRIGEQFEFFSDKEEKYGLTRTNVVTQVYHVIEENEIFIWYDFFFCWENTTLKPNKQMDEKRVPQEKLGDE